MKPIKHAATMVAIIAVNTLLTQRTIAVSPNGNSGSTSTIPSIPKGDISAYPAVVQSGTKPNLTWNILFPSNLSGLNPMVSVNPPGTLLSNAPVYATVQIVGNGVTACNTTQDPLEHYVDVRLSLNGGNYSQIFYGNSTNVVPSKQLYIKKMTANQTLDFGASYVINGSSAKSVGEFRFGKFS
jgi:hypothetical protein